MQFSVINIEIGGKVELGKADIVGKLLGKPKILYLSLVLAGSFPFSMKYSEAKGIIEGILKNHRKKGVGKLVTEGIVFNYKLGFIFKDVFPLELIEILSELEYNPAAYIGGKLDIEALDEPYVEGFRLFLWPITPTHLKRIASHGYNLMRTIQLELNKEYISSTLYLVIWLEKGKGAVAKAKIESRLKKKKIKFPYIMVQNLEDKDVLEIALMDYRVLEAINRALRW